MSLSGARIFPSPPRLDITNGVAHGGDCPAGTNGDPVCKHRSAYYFGIGLFGPEPPTPAAPAAVLCSTCGGEGAQVVASRTHPIVISRVTCRVCGGTGETLTVRSATQGVSAE